MKIKIFGKEGDLKMINFKKFNPVTDVKTEETYF